MVELIGAAGEGVGINPCVNPAANKRPLQTLRAITYSGIRRVVSELREGGRDRWIISD